MKILMLTPYLPYPLFSGGQIRSYNIIKQLAKNHSVTLFSLIRSDDEKKHIPKLTRYCSKVIFFKRKKAFSLSNILLSGFTHKPFILNVYNHKQLKEALQEELEKEQYDLIHVETFYVMHNMPKTSIPLILFEQNIEYDVYHRIADYFEPSFLRPFLLFDVYKMKKWEEYFWKKAKALVVMSKVDKQLVNRDAFVCGNGVDIDQFKVQSASWRTNFKVNEREKHILFIGNFKWFENVDAARFILKEVWPAFVKTSAGKPHIKLWIVGREIPESIKRLASGPNVTFDEHAPEDTREIYKKASILLAPIRAGGGTSFKVLEAMAAGVPVVTTSFGNAGIGAGHREAVLVGDSAEELTQNLVDVLQDQKLYNSLSKNARKLIEEKYDWKIIIKKLERVYDEITRNSREY